MKKTFIYTIGLVSGFFLSSMISCGNGPQVTVYLSDPINNGMEYYDEKTKQQGFIPYSQTDNFLCLNESDAQTLLDFCGVKK